METLLLELAASAPPSRAPRLLAAKPSSGATSPDTSSTEACCRCAATTKGKRHKRTYYARKHELEELQGESTALSRKVKKLKDEARRRQQPLLNALAAKAALQTHVSQNRLLIADLQSLLAASSGARQIDPPIGCYIHMPHDPTKRERIVNDMKQPKLREALAYLLRRSSTSDLRIPCRQLENYVTREGAHVGLHWEVVLFDNPPGRTLTVTQVFDELVGFLRDQEMAIAETLGLLTVRESDAGDDDVGAKQLRVVAAHNEHVTTEKNLVQFAEYFDKSDLLDVPHGLVVVDYVDRDDAFPYQPDTRIRKDVASAKLVVQCPPLLPDDSPAIALVNWSYVSIHKSALATPSELDAMSREALPEYFDAFVQIVRERLAWRKQLDGDQGLST